MFPQDDVIKFVKEADHFRTAYAIVVAPERKEASPKSLNPKLSKNPQSTGIPWPTSVLEVSKAQHGQFKVRVLTGHGQMLVLVLVIGNFSSSSIPSPSWI